MRKSALDAARVQKKVKKGRQELIASLKCVIFLR